MNSHIKQPPKAVGLYDPRFEHDACGVGMVARLDNRPTHEVISRAITALENLEHRGASGADPSTGDGAGILMQMPDELLRSTVDFELPAPGQYGVLMCFLPRDADARAPLEQLLERTVGELGQRLLGWREVPINEQETGKVAAACRPVIRQLFVGAGAEQAGDQDAFERKLYVIRRVCELHAQGAGLYVASSSSRTINYKGMLISFQLAAFYEDLRDERAKSAMALVHSRFSTNTFPSWELAHPYRVICHNGEINTVMGNVNWMCARERELRSELFGEDLERILPVVSAGNSDSATFDNVLELLMLAGRSLPHAAMMMIPEAYRDREDLPDYLKGFYAFHSCLMEPWDGPASVAFTDGRVVGATLDRNGLRPGRWVETTDGYVVLGSESGLLDIPPEQVRRLGRLQPGKLFLVDLERGRIVEDEEVKREVACRRPYGEWFARNGVPFAELPPSSEVTLSDQPLRSAPARLRLHAGGPPRPARADGDRSGRADRLDGQRPHAGGAVRPGAAAVLLLQAAVRPGHQPADRPDPRGDRDEPRDQPRQRAQPVRRDARARPQAAARPADPAQPRARDAAPRRPRGLRGADDRRDLADRGGAGRDARGAGAHLRARRTRRSRDGVNIIILSDRAFGPTASADPLAARRRRGPPPPRDARARACGRGSSSSPASRARSTTSPR